MAEYSLTQINARELQRRSPRHRIFDVIDHKLQQVIEVENLNSSGFYGLVLLLIPPVVSYKKQLCLYMMVRHLKPRRYIEVGSGLSTFYCSLAAERNAKECHPLEITCIEPHPFEKLRTIPGIKLLEKEVQDAETSLFQQLQENDILFIDSSHVLKIDGDVPFLYLEVLPSPNAGVVIHIHDVPFPYNIPYPPQLWVFGQESPMLWNEAMVLQALLCFNDKFKITMSTPLIRYYDEGFLKSKIPFYETLEQNPNTFSSIWLKRA